MYLRFLSLMLTAWFLIPLTLTPALATPQTQSAPSLSYFQRGVLTNPYNPTNKGTASPCTQDVNILSRRVQGVCRPRSGAGLLGRGYAFGEASLCAQDVNVLGGGVGTASPCTQDVNILSRRVQGVCRPQSGAGLLNLAHPQPMSRPRQTGIPMQSRTPAPSASASPSASVTPAPVPAQGAGMGLLLKPDPQPSAKTVKELKPESRPSSLATSFLGADDWSQYTLSGPRPAFIDGEQRLSLPLAEPSIELARFVNGTARTLVAVVVWLTEQTLSFGLGAQLIPVATTLGNGLQHEVIGKIRLGDVALLAALMVIAWRWVTGNHAHAIRDLLIGVTIVGLGLIGMANPTGPVCASLSVIGGLTRFFVSLTSGANPGGFVDMCAAPSTDLQVMVAPIKQNLFTTFVQEPFLALQWGELSAQCKSLALDIANAGYFGDSPEPRHVMAHNGCAQAAQFNGSAGIDRAVFAGVHLLTVLGWSVGMVALLAPVILAQGVSAVLIVSAPIIWAVAMIPGLGHQALGAWLYMGFKAALGMMLSGALLAIILHVSLALAPTDQRLIAIMVPTMMVLGLASVQWQQRRGRLWAS